jgi:Group II intron, maturase-specific domain
MNAMRETIRQLNIRRQTQRSLADIAQLLNPLLRGWIEYYGALCAIGAASRAGLRESRARGMGKAEVQALQGSQDPRGPFL